jgi:hypothetical protein
MTFEVAWRMEAGHILACFSSVPCYSYSFCGGRLEEIRTSRRFRAMAVASEQPTPAGSNRCRSHPRLCWKQDSDPSNLTDNERESSRNEHVDTRE